MNLDKMSLALLNGDAPFNVGDTDLEFRQKVQVREIYLLVIHIQVRVKIVNRDGVLQGEDIEQKSEGK
jgi:hypothetical protein